MTRASVRRSSPASWAQVAEQLMRCAPSAICPAHPRAADVPMDVVVDTAPALHQPRWLRRDCRRRWPRGHPSGVVACYPDDPGCSWPPC